jgi:DNA repair protein RecO (recombination protein O)
LARAPARPGTAAFVLHSHDWSESSLILEVFTRDHGRVVAVAKGAKRPYSQLRPVLMPFQRLVMGFGAKKADEADVWLLRQAEWAGGPAWPGGAALLPGFYLNELLMRLMVRHDPHPALFDAYAQALQAMGDPALLHAALRAFELVLLRQLGLLPGLDASTVNGQDVVAGRVYELHPEFGLRAALGAQEPGQGPVVIDGAVYLDIERALRSTPRQPERLTSASDELPALPMPSSIPTVMAACMPALAELKPVLRGLIHYHLGSQTLRTRQLMMELPQP